MSPIVLFMFTILISFPTIKSQDIKKTTCNQCMYKDTCSQTLAKSTATDVRGLATDAMRSLMGVGEESLKKIEAAKGTSQGLILDHLSTCVEVYKTANNHTSEAVRALEADKTEDAIIQVSSAMRIQRTCEEGFKRDNLKNPVDNVHSWWVKQANVALTISTLVHPSGTSVPLVSEFSAP